MLRQLVAFPTSWFCWGVGHCAYLILSLNDDSENWCAYWYRPYNNWMIASSQVQDWAEGRGRFWPWDEVSHG